MQNRRSKILLRLIFVVFAQQRSALPNEELRTLDTTLPCGITSDTKQLHVFHKFKQILFNSFIVHVRVSSKID